MAAVILVTGFEPFGAHPDNPSRHVAKAVDGRRVGAQDVRGVVLPVHHSEAGAIMERLLLEQDPAAVIHLGLAEGRARIGLERVAVNVMDYPSPDNAGHTATDQPCVPGGPAAYFSTLPLRALLDALTTEGIPAALSSSAGTYLCNQTMYLTLHTIARRRLRARAGFVHVPLLPAMVAASRVEAPSMDLALVQRAVETIVRVVGDHV
jgi:pyroglutamyl-peptidase